MEQIDLEGGGDLENTFNMLMESFENSNNLLQQHSNYPFVEHFGAIFE